MDCSLLSSSPWLAAWQVDGECNQSCQQYRSDYSISPKPATKRFLIFRIELLILIDDLSAHRTPPGNKPKMDCGTESDEMCVNCFTLRWLSKKCTLTLRA